MPSAFSLAISPGRGGPSAQPGATAPRPTPRRTVRTKIVIKDFSLDRLCRFIVVLPFMIGFLFCLYGAVILQMLCHSLPFRPILCLSANSCFQSLIPSILCGWMIQGGTGMRQLFKLLTPSGFYVTRELRRKHFRLERP